MNFCKNTIKSGIDKVKIVKNMQFNSCFVVYVIDYNACIIHDMIYGVYSGRIQEKRFFYKAGE